MLKAQSTPSRNADGVLCGVVTVEQVRRALQAAFGTPGGDQQDQWQLLLLLGWVADGLDLQSAIDAPAWHSNAVPSSFTPRQRDPLALVIEPGFTSDVVAELGERGHDVIMSGSWSLGRLSAVSRDPDTGILRAAANPRGMQGYAAGR